MEIEVLKNELKQLIAKGKNEAALEKLLAIVPTQAAETSNLIFSLSSSYETYKRNLSFGTLSEENEKQFANELTFRLLTIVDQLEEQPAPVTTNNTITDQVDAVPNTRIHSDILKPLVTPVQPKKKSNIPLLSVLTAGVLLIALLAFFFTREGTSSQLGITKESWTGEWQHELYMADNPTLKTTGHISIQSDQQTLTGSGELVYPVSNSPTAVIRLSHIELKDNLLSGQWASDLVDPQNPQKGTFQFTLSLDQQTFSGVYTFVKTPDTRHIWKGTKTNK